VVVGEWIFSLIFTAINCMSGRTGLTSEIITSPRVLRCYYTGGQWDAEERRVEESGLRMSPWKDNVNVFFCTWVLLERRLR